MGILGGVRGKFLPAGRPCDYCKSAAALLFCRVDSAFMCMACDAKVHSLKGVGVRHERVWMCEVCEQSPAVVTCRADAAALCVTCDNDIHSANPLARRHERFSVVPFYDTAESVITKSFPGIMPIDESPVVVADGVLGSSVGERERKLGNCLGEEGYLADSWISSNPVVSTKIQENYRDVKPMEFLFPDSDQFLDFDGYQVPSQPYSDSVVPVQTTIKPPALTLVTEQSPENRFEIDFKKSTIRSFQPISYNTPSLSQSISSSSLDVGVVPDGSSLSDLSHPFGRSMPAFDLNGNQTNHAAGMDREARVMRYKEKRKNRKFEKTIRYASRKAYAETRPRIKGRFAKRTDPDTEIDRFFIPGSSNFLPDSRYGVVPSF